MENFKPFQLPSTWKVKRGMTGEYIAHAAACHGMLVAHLKAILLTIADHTVPTARLLAIEEIVKSALRRVEGKD